MPELPEVETVRKELSKQVTGLTFETVTCFYQPSFSKGSDSITGRKIDDVKRRGKYLIFCLDDGSRLLIHLRMEGKLFFLPQLEKKEDYRHVTVEFSFKETEKRLYFIDVRKFGRVQLLSQGEEGPLSNLGPEPFD